MATTTYEPIVSYTLPSSASNVILGSGGQGTIPSTYTDLVLVVSGGITSGGENFLIQFNGDTGSNYSDTRIVGNGSTAASYRSSSQTSMIIGNIYSGQGNIILQIQNYANTTTYKTVLSRVNYPANLTSSHVGLWRGTPAAITSIKLLLSGDNFASGTTFTLYGIANADSGAKATGGVITYDDTYFYHTFGASGTFTPKQSLTADILVVAGGGGGGNGWAGGGGGAGGLLGFASQALTATGYTVTVGAGGAGAPTGAAAAGTTGVDSQFGALTLVKGGGYGAGNTMPGGNGGSGGGGARNQSGGSATSGQGYNGGAGWPNPTTAVGDAFGGGGGAGQVGADGVGGSGQAGGGKGGNGLSTYSSYGLATGTGENISGTVYYAGGGGGGAEPYVTFLPGGAGGYGGGGAGGGVITAGSSGVTGKPNTGGGGGGVSTATPWNQSGGNGGSGVVIVRYLKA